MWPIAMSSLPPKLPLWELTATSTHTNTEDAFLTPPEQDVRVFVL
jgi:hypothetical protein